jgi:glycosyltransferase involved in cell wall biosynthesis
MNGVVAVVIPAFRCEDTIIATLDSVLGQNRKPDHVVIVLDEPNPDLEAMCRAHGIGAEVIVNQVNLGVGASRNIGYERIQHLADYFCFLDSDDILHPDFLHAACLQYEYHPDADAVFGNFLLWYDGTAQESIATLSPDNSYLLQDALDTYLSNTGSYLLSFALIRKTSIAATAVDGKVNIECLRNNQDFKFICRLFFQGNIIRLEDRCGWHLKLPASLSSNQARAWHFRSVAAGLLYNWLSSRGADKTLLSRMRHMEHSAIRKSARLQWKKGDKKQAVLALLGSIAKFQIKSVAQLIVLLSGMEHRRN